MRQRFPLIVIDGPDGTGKSTLARAICEQTGARYRHLTYRFRNQMHRYHTAALELCLKDLATRPVVLDRWWPSELAYAAVFRGGSPWALLEARMLDRVALKHRAHYVICLPQNREDYLQAYDVLKHERAEMFDQMAGVYDAYLAILTWLGRSPLTRVHRYDRLTQNLRQAAQNLYAVAADNLEAHDDFGFMRDVGDRRFAGQSHYFADQVLLVGDQSKRKGRREVWPFFDTGNSSAWLAKALERLGVQECRLSWINANGLDGRLQWEHDELTALREMSHTIVALGSKAADALDRAGFPPDLKLRHPQWYQRFDPAAGQQDLATIFGALRLTNKTKERSDAARALFIQ